MSKTRKLNCKLIVSDFDGTLADSNNCVSTENVNAINKYVEDGGIFAVCTGRILPSILPRVRQIGLKGLIIACQGSVVADIDSGEILRNVKLESAQAAKICAVLESLDANVQAYTDEGFYTDMPADSPYLQLYEKITGITATHAGLPVSAYLSKNNIRCQKIATLVANEEQEALFSKLRSAFGGEFEVTCSAKVLIEIVPVGENKGTALRFLSQYYGVDRDKICAVGDNLNDLSMLREAGYGVAVGNCAPALRQRVKLFTVTNDENAVARVIDEYGYEKHD